MREEKEGLERSEGGTGEKRREDWRKEVKGGLERSEGGLE